MRPREHLVGSSGCRPAIGAAPSTSLCGAPAPHRALPLRIVVATAPRIGRAPGDPGSNPRNHHVDQGVNTGTARLDGSPSPRRALGSRRASFMLETSIPGRHDLERPRSRDLAVIGPLRGKRAAATPRASGRIHPRCPISSRLCRRGRRNGALSRGGFVTGSRSGPAGADRHSAASPHPSDRPTEGQCHDRDRANLEHRSCAGYEASRVVQGHPPESPSAARW
jgi:hypothetical protein